MSRMSYTVAGTALAAACLGVSADAQQPSPAPFATTKVEGTEHCGLWGRGT
jgi:hypothetical protein